MKHLLLSALFCLPLCADVPWNTEVTNGSVSVIATKLERAAAPPAIRAAWTAEEGFFVAVKSANQVSKFRVTAHVRLVSGKTITRTQEVALRDDGPWSWATFQYGCAESIISVSVEEIPPSRLTDF